jgi:hypothetical protein
MAKENKITGKKSNIKLNPRTEEIMERHRKLAEESILSKLGSLREEQDDFDCLYVDEFSDEELEEIAEEVLSELDSEEREEIFEAIESDLLEVISERMDPKEIQRRRDQAKDRLQTGASMKKAADKSAADKAKPSRGSRLKSALKSAAKKVASSAGKVAGEFSAAKDKQKEKAMSRPSSGGSSDGGSSSGSSSSSSSSTSSTSSAPRERKRDKIKRALKKGIGKVARAVSRGARGVARRMGEDFKGFGAFVSEGSCGGGYSYGGKVAKKSAGGKTTVKKEESEAEAEEITEKKSEEGFAGEATSYKGVVIKRTESGYEAPRFNLTGKSVDSLKANIDKELAKVESYQPDAANNYNGPLYAPWSAVEEGKKKGLWANIHAKRKRGEKPAKPGDKDYPETLNVEGYGVGEVDQKLKTDRDGMRIPNKDAAAAKARLLAKAAEKRKAKGMKEETVSERADTWHPDPDEDRKLGGPGANQRAREDRAAASKPAAKKSDPKKLRKGESYMDYAKRQKGYTPAKKKEGLGSKIKRKLGLKKENYMSFSEFLLSEDRAEDAKKSLDKVKARQKVLDAHEKKTGKKLDISKTPEHKDHKKNFPGAKRTGKKVKGQKETPAQTQDRRIRQSSSRIAKRGYTSKEKKEVQSMAKHASRYD